MICISIWENFVERLYVLNEGERWEVYQSLEDKSSIPRKDIAGGLGANPGGDMPFTLATASNQITIVVTELSLKLIIKSIR